MMQDLRLALRSLAKSPAFTATVVATLALTLGATTTIFSAVHGVLLRPLDFPEPDRLVTVWENQTARGGPEREWTGRTTFRDWRQRNRSLAGLAGFTGWSADLVETTEDGSPAAGGAAPERLQGAAVTPGYLAVLGVEPAVGRAFRAEEEEPGRDDVVILTHELWQRRFGADPDVVGSTIRLSDTPHTVIGVLPPGFTAPLQPAAEILRPLPIPADMDDRGSYYVRAIGRIAPGVSRQQADADMVRVGRELAAEHPRELEGVDLDLQDLRSSIVGPMRTPLSVLLGAAVLVLLIAGANVASLLLVRATVREGEMAVRSALGAGRSQLLRQHLVEGLLLAAAGAVAAFGVAAWGVELLRRLAPPGLPRIDGIALDGPVLLFTAVAALVTGLAFSAAPAWQAARPRLAGALVSGAREVGSRRGSVLRRGLVVAEIALGLALLTGAALLLRSLDELGRTDVGLRVEATVVAGVGLPSEKYSDGARINAFYDDVLTRLAADPSVRAAGAVDVLPLSGDQSDTSFVVEGEATEPGREPVTDVRVVTPGYFTAAGIPLLAGRGFDQRDAAEAPGSVIVSRRFAERYLPGRDPLGVRLKGGSADNDQPWKTIVGVVGSVRDNAVSRAPDPEIYVPLAQNPSRFMTLVAWAPQRPEAAMQALRGAVAAVDPERPLAAVGTMEELLSRSLSPSRLVTVLVVAFAAVAMLLSLLGIYGVTAYAVGQRRREIGVRMALGADRRRVVGLVLSGGGRLVVLGLVLGVGLSLVLGRALVGLLYGVTPGDPLTLAASALLLALAAAGACWLPARRASRIDPVTALREG